MSEEQPKRRRKATNVTYSSQIPHYDSAEGMEMLRRIADARGISATAALRQLVREEVRRMNDQEKRQ